MLEEQLNELKCARCYRQWRRLVLRRRWFQGITTKVPHHECASLLCISEGGGGCNQVTVVVKVHDAKYKVEFILIKFQAVCARNFPHFYGVLSKYDGVKQFNGYYQSITLHQIATYCVHYS